MFGLPEIDSFMWVEKYSDAAQMVFKSQKFMFAENYVELRLKEIAEEKERLLNNPPPVVEAETEAQPTKEEEKETV